MARVQYSGVVSSMKGSIAGTTFQSNKAASIARKKPRVPGVGSALQTPQKSVFSSLLAGWQSLTLTQQQAWNAYADAHTQDNFWGEEKVLTGMNWFISMNSTRLAYNNSILTTPPTYALPDAIPDFTVSATAGTIVIVFDGTFTSSDHMYIFVTPHITTPSLTNRRRLRRVYKTVDFSYHVINLTSSWENTFNFEWTAPAGSGLLYTIIGVQMIHHSSYVKSAAKLGIGSFMF